MIYESSYYVGSDLNGDSLAHGADAGCWESMFDNPDNILSHHGVPHQKWGVKNGPPYPIQRGSTVHYNVGKMTSKTKDNLAKAGKITAGAVKGAVKAAGTKVASSFKKWKDNKKAELAIADTNNKLVKNWQKKQLRISDMTSQELQQRIDRKRLEETYKHALRGDFSDPKSWKNSKAGKNGKEAADSILKRVGNSVIDGFAKGLSGKIEQSMTAKAKAKVARREARRDALAEVSRNAAKERAEYRAQRRNESWKQRKNDQEDVRNERRKRRYNDSMNRARTGKIGLGDGSSSNYYYYSPPDEWSIS